MKNELLTVCDQAVAATVNGMYQGVLLAVLVALGLNLLGRTNAATRHGVWLITLVLLVGLIPAHYWLDFRPVNVVPAINQGGPSMQVEKDLGNPPELFRRAAPEADFPVQPARSRVGAAGFDTSPDAGPCGQEEWAASLSLVWPAPDPLAIEAKGGSGMSVLSATTAPGLSAPQVPSLPPSQSRETQHAGPKLNLHPISWNLASPQDIPRWTGIAVVTLWAGVVAIKLGWLMRRLWGLREQKRRSLPASPALEELFQRLCARLGVRRQVALRVSQMDSSPVVLGFVHPVVLLPSFLLREEEAGETEHVLRHELAHVQRQDDWANLFQRLVHVVFFFHPAVLWISRRLSIEREIACDDCVLEHVRQPGAYAMLLANLAGRMRTSPPLLAPGASTSKNQLKQRISMILDTHRDTSPRLAKTRLGFIVSTAALTALLSLLGGPRLVLAQPAAPRAANSQPNAPGTAPVVAGQALSSAAAPAASRNVGELNAPSAPASANDDSGPKYKPDNADEPASPSVSAVAVAPVPPVPGVPRMPGAGALVAVNPYPVPGPVPPPPPGASFEQRLERLERMVRSLMAQQHGPRGTPFAYSVPEQNKEFPGPKEFEQWNQLARQQADRVEREAKRAAEETKRAAKEFDKAMKERSDLARNARKQASQQQLESLRHARENLQRQVEKLNEEIKRLEQDKDKLEQDHPRPGDIPRSHNAHPQVESGSAPQPADGETIQEEAPEAAAR